MPSALTLLCVVQRWQSIDRRKLVSLLISLCLCNRRCRRRRSASRPLVPPERERVAIYKLNSVKLNYFICRQRVIDGDGSSDGGGGDGLMT